MLLKDKIAIVTGGSSGNGRAIAQKFASEGAKVIVADLTTIGREGGTPTAETIIAQTPDAARFVTCDVTKIADLEALVQTAED